MKKILILIFLISSIIVSAANHTVGIGGTFTTIAQVNAHTFVAGDSISFKRGETFYGTLTISQSGISGNPIVITAYGTGNNPIITGLSTVTGWTTIGGGVYSKALNCESAPNLLIIDGVQYAMGRYPNSGWLYYESHSGTTSITDNQLTGTPNWTGAEAVIRKSAFVIDRNPITNHSTSTLTITNTGALTNGWGYYVQNDLDALDQYGEWYYNTATSTLYVYFGAVDPATKTTQLPTIDYGITPASGIDYLTFDNLSVYGYNKRGVGLSGNDFITVQNCNITYAGQIGIRISGCLNTSIINNTVKKSNDIGILTASGANNTLIQGNTIDSTENILCQGLGNYLSGVGIYAFQGSDMIVEYNRVTNTGYCGIKFGGNNQIVKYNLIDNFCLFQTDGGGIYYGDQNLYSNMLIHNNIIANGFGNTLGEPIGTVNGAAGGIYIDYGATGGVTIRDNSIYNCSGPGIWNHASNNITVRNNTVYDCVQSIHLQETPDVGVAITNMDIKSNKFISKSRDQLTFWGRLNIGNSWTTIGNLDSNYYARPIDDNLTIKALVGSWDATAITLNAFKTLTTKDINSNKSPFGVADESLISFYYNDTTVNQTTIFSGRYADVTGTLYTDSIVLAPYTSAVLLLDTSYAPNPAILGTVILDSPYNTTSRGVTIYAYVATDGGGTISERGIVWNTSANPTTSNNKQTAGSGIGVYKNELTTLLPSTKYYLRGYAISEAGTSYSNQVIINTTYSSKVMYRGKSLKLNGNTLRY